MVKRIKSLTRKKANSMFSTIGLCLIIFCLIVLFIPTIGNILVEYMFPQLVSQKNIYFLIVNGITALGTLISFGFLGLSMGVKGKDYFSRSSFSSKDTFIEFLAFFSFVSLAIFITCQITNYFGIQPSLVYSIGSVIDNTEFENIVYMGFFIVVFPIIEEICFRGIMLSALSRFGKKFALFISAIVYALAHGSFTEMFTAFAIAYILGKITYRAESIRPCIVIHIFFNAIIYGLCFIPESFILYEVIFLAVIYLSTLFLIITGRRQFIVINSTQNYSLVLSLFFKNPIAVMSLLLLTGHSILLYLL